MRRTRYKLLPEHAKHFPEIRARCIANAMSTKHMDEQERELVRHEVNELYKVCGKPPPQNIVFVPSPFVLRFAGGFAAWIWYKRSTSGRSSVKTRYDATDNATRAATRDATNDATDIATRAATRDATYYATYYATHDATNDATDIATRAATRDATDIATDDATNDATDDATDDATGAATDDATYAKTRAVTYAATYVETRDATDIATDNATRAATRDATDIATDNATRAATRDATYDATYDATRDATRDTTNDATRDAPEHLSSMDKWYRFSKNMGKTAALFHEDIKAMLRCAQSIQNMWNGGNQWSAWCGYHIFFRDVAKLGLPEYEAYSHYEKLAFHSGPRIIHKNFCMISDRPKILTVDAQNRPHNETGPFCEWRDGSALFAWHGVRTPAWVILHPEYITVDKINFEENLEIKRVLMERYGLERYILDSKMQEIHSDSFGRLFRLPEALFPVVLVKNSTAEPDGTYKNYVLTATRQDVKTAHEAVASTFGLTAEQYQPVHES